MSADLLLESGIRAGDLAAARTLLRAGTNVNRRGPEGFPPLLIAAGLGQAQMVELLLTAGADVLMAEPRMGTTALHKAAQSGNADVVGLLLDYGAFADQQSPAFGQTALMDAVIYKHAEVVQALLRRGARTAIQNHWQETALDLARRDGLATITRALEAHDATNQGRVRAQTLLAAVKAGAIGEVERLLTAGAAVNERAPLVGNSDDGYTPLGIAAREGTPALVRVLLDAGADPRRATGLMRGTPVHEAAYFGRTEVLRTLTAPAGRAGTPTPNLDAQGPYNGLTALHDAVWHGHLAAVRVLVEAGARLDLTTHAGHTPRELALHYGYEELAHFLAEAEQQFLNPSL